MRLKFFLPLVLVLWLASTVDATTVKRLDLDGLVATAGSIVIGTVETSESFWTLDGRLILTRSTIAVDETLKGLPAGRVDVTTVGGTVGDLTLHVAGMPAFAAGERAVVFLEATGPYRTVLGLGQGKFSVEGDTVRNDVTDLDFPDGAPGRSIRMDLSRFREEIRSRLRR